MHRLSKHITPILLSLWLSTSSGICAEGDQDQYLNLQQSRDYMVSLINKDRQANGLSPVVLDLIASQAGQIHTEDMVLNNHHGHYDVDGKKPWQRYTQSGGQGYVSENAFWWPARHYEGLSAEEMSTTDESKPFTLHAVQTFKKSDIEEAESAYYNEKPPNDGHRKNILNPLHNAVGIAFSLASNGSMFRFANTQEFTDNYGQFEALPNDMSSPFYVSGTLPPGWNVYCVSISWEAAPKAMAPEEIEKLHSYKHPTNRLDNYFSVQWAKVPMQIRNFNGMQQFRVLVTPQKNWKPGLFYVDIDAQFKGGKPQMISRRTIPCYTSGFSND